MKTLQSIAAILLLGLSVAACSSNDDNSNLTCEEATAATLAASQAFDAATSANLEAKCNAYKHALQNEIAACGDETGALQAMIDDLGDCTISSAGSITATVGTLPMTFDILTITTVGNTLKIKAEREGSDNFIYFEVEKLMTGTDIISNFKINLFTRDYFPASTAFGTFTSTITQNSSTKVVGSFYGIVLDATTNTAQELTQGVIDLNL